MSSNKNNTPVIEMSLKEMQEQVESKTKKGAHKITVSIAVVLTIVSVFLGEKLALTEYIGFFLAILFGCYFWFHWWLSKGIAMSHFDEKMRDESPTYKKWAELNDKREEKRENDEKKRENDEKEKKALERAKEIRIKKVRSNDAGVLQSAFVRGFDCQKICYWCGAEQNFLEYISGIKRGQSYEYMNSDGTPDKRYRDNPMSIKFDAKYQCKNCSAEIECRHYSNEEPYEDGLVSVGWVTKKGVTEYNETGLLRDTKTEDVAKLPDDKDFSDYCNSNNTYFHRPWYV